MTNAIKFIQSLATLDGSYDESGFRDLKHLLSWKSVVTPIVLVEDKYRVSGETIPVLSLTALLQLLLSTDYRSGLVYLTFKGNMHVVTNKEKAKEYVKLIEEYVRDLYANNKLPEIELRATLIPRSPKRKLKEKLLNQVESWLGSAYPVVFNYVRTKGLARDKRLNFLVTVWELMGFLSSGIVKGNLYDNESFILPARNFVLTANFMNRALMSNAIVLTKQVYKVDGTDVILNFNILDTHGFLTSSLSGCLQAIEKGVVFKVSSLKVQ